jgi:TolA-binding protein
MSKRGCVTQEELEVHLRGSLVGKALQSFERHCSECDRCRSAVREARLLDDAVRAAPTAERTDAEHRQRRVALLEAARQRGREPTPSPRPIRLGLALSLAGAAFLAFVVVRTRAPNDDASGRSTSSDAPRDGSGVARFDVVDERAASWTVSTTSESTRVALSSGAATFRVAPLEAGKRFVVAVPDGEVEVRGTRFLVEVDAGRTTRVVVTEGKVDVRIAGFDGSLRAGETWTPASGTSLATEPSAAPEASGDAPKLVPSVAAAGRSASPASATASAVPHDSTAPNAGRPAGPAFAEAVSAHRAGEYVRAEQLFAAFVVEFPRDGRSEDATFLVAESRARRGDKAGAAEAARAYLRAYPRGLRRPEAERLAGSSESSNAAPNPHESPSSQ